LIIKFLPQGLLYGFAESVASLSYLIAAKQRRIALESLRIAFGRQLSDAQRTEIAKDSFRNMAKSGVELLSILERPYVSKEVVSIEGRQYLDEAFSKGNGIIAVSAHFGNFPLALTRLRQDGYKVNVILRRMRDEKVEDFLDSRRHKMGINSIHSTPRRACVESSVRALRDNELLFIQLDQNFGTGGIFVDFFGQKAATATGPVVLSLRTQASILPMFIARTQPRRHKIFIEPPLIIEKKDAPDETLQYNIQKITSIIEAYIRRYPSEWGWIHRRWKSRPSQ
jgi:KDO2-lipid IV(A) lauroyltransferase